jgi:hypothetical protein
MSLLFFPSLPNKNKEKTMMLLRNDPYRRLCPPGTHSASIKSLYTFWSMSCALGFAKNEGGTPIFYHHLL